MNEAELIASINGPFGGLTPLQQQVMSNYVKLLVGAGMPITDISFDPEGPYGEALVVTHNPQVTVVMTFLLAFPT